MKLYPESNLGQTGFWVTFISAALLGLKFAGVMPLPTMLIFGLIFIGSGISIGAFIRKDPSWLQVIVVAPVLLFALVWSLAEVIWPH